MVPNFIIGDYTDVPAPLTFIRILRGNLVWFAICTSFDNSYSVIPRKLLNWDCSCGIDRQLNFVYH